MDLYPVEGSYETFEPMWTCQGILHFPRRILIESIWVAEGESEEEAWEEEEDWKRWEVPDYDKWLSVPGFPDFLEDPSKLSPAAVRPLTPEERREYDAKRKPAGKPVEVAPCLEFVAGSTCIRLGGKLVRLSGRGHALLWNTVDREALPREAAVELLQGVEPESAQGAKGIVEFDALHDHRKAILRKVEAEVGLQSKELLAAAFRAEGGVFLYDPSSLPVRRK